MFQFKQYNWKRINASLIIVVLVLNICSAFIVRFAAQSQFKKSYFIGQIVAMFFGLFIMAFVALVDYHFICRLVPLLYLVGTVLVMLTRIGPLKTDLKTGSYRWIKIGFNFQPSEICKIVIILTLAVYYVYMRDKMDKFTTLIYGAILFMIPTFFILTQSDLSSSLVIVFIFAIMTYAAGLSYKIIIPVLSVGIPTFIGLLIYIQMPGQKLLKDYQLSRIMAFFNPDAYAQGAAYQQNMSILSIGSGRLVGKVLEDSTQGARNYVYVDVTESDFIFTVIGEELGFIGSCAILALLAIVVIKCLRVAKKASDYQGKLIAIGIASMFMFQVFANVGVATRLLPNTGLPLPFLSRGMSSTLSSAIGIGIILNIGLQSGNGPRNGFSLSDYD